MYRILLLIFMDLQLNQVLELDTSHMNRADEGHLGELVGRGARSERHCRCFPPPPLRRRHRPHSCLSIILSKEDSVSLTLRVFLSCQNRLSRVPASVRPTMTKTIVTTTMTRAATGVEGEAGHGPGATVVAAGDNGRVAGG